MLKKEQQWNSKRIAAIGAALCTLYASLQKKTHTRIHTFTVHSAHTLDRFDAGNNSQNDVQFAWFCDPNSVINQSIYCWTKLYIWVEWAKFRQLPYLVTVCVSACSRQPNLPNHCLMNSFCIEMPYSSEWNHFPKKTVYWMEIKS